MRSTAPPLAEYAATPTCVAAKIRELRASASGVSGRFTVTALKKLELSVNHWDAIFVFMTVSRLDESTHRAWELEISNLEDFPTFNQLTLFVNSRIQALELVHTSTGKPANTPAARLQSKAPTPKLARAQVYHGATAPSKCPLCPSGNHVLKNCPPFFENSETD